MLQTISLAPGVSLRAMQTDQFKTGFFSVNLICRHDRATAGLASLLPNVLLRATQKHPSMERVSSHLDALYGACAGALCRRKGEIKLTGLYFDYVEDCFLPEPIFDRIVDFLRELLFEPLTENGCFCASVFESERANLIDAIEASINSRRSYAVMRMLETMCAEEDYGVPQLGSVQDAEALSAEALWAFYQHLLRHARIEVYYAGRLRAEEAAARFAPVFSALGARRLTEVAPTVIRAEAPQVRRVEETMDVTQANLVIGLRTGLTAADPDYPAMTLLSAVYGGGMTSKLFLNVREARSLCYFVGSTLDKYKGLMVVSAGIDASKRQEAEEAIFAELDACRCGQITDEELSSARTQVLSSLRRAMDVPSDLDDFYLGLALTGADDLPVLMKKLQNVTRNDLVRAARRLQTDTIYLLRREA